MTHQLRSAEQCLARWVTYGSLAAPLVAILSPDLRLGAITPWIIYASIAVPMMVMLSHRELDVDARIRWNPLRNHCIDPDPGSATFMASRTGHVLTNPDCY